MKELRGVAKASKGATNWGVSLDFGTFAVWAQNAVPDPLNNRRVTAQGTVAIIDGGNMTEFPARSVSWALDGQGFVTDLVANADVLRVQTTGSTVVSPTEKNVSGLLYDFRG